MNNITTINFNNIKIGDCLLNILTKQITVVTKINTMFIYGAYGHRIYQKDFKYYIKLTLQEVKAMEICSFNDQLKELINNLKELKSSLNLINTPYLTVDSREAERDIEYLIYDLKEYINMHLKKED